MIVLPEEKIKATAVSASTILMYSKPKQGKTTALSLLEDSIIIDTEKGSGFVEARKIQIDTTKPEHEQYKEFMDICRAIYMKGYNTETKVYTPFYKYLIVDTLSRVDEWSEVQGTLEYMDKAQGKKMNRNAKGEVISPTSKDFETVHDMPNGYGYKHSRATMLELYDRVCTLAPRVIFVCHTKDKIVATNLTESVMTKEISLTGKLKDIIASKVDTIMYCYRDGNKLMASFSGEDGTRCSYLSGKTIVLTESDDKGKIVVNNWNQIFID